MTREQLLLTFEPTTAEEASWLIRELRHEFMQRPKVSITQEGESFYDPSHGAFFVQPNYVYAIEIETAKGGTWTFKAAMCESTPQFECTVEGG